MVITKEKIPFRTTKLLLHCHLEKLDSDAGEHELQQSRDNHDVSDGPDGHKHTLDHVLEHMMESHKEPSLEEPKPRARLTFGWMAGGQKSKEGCTFSPLARLMALKGLSTRRTLRIFTTEMALELQGHA